MEDFKRPTKDNPLALGPLGWLSGATAQPDHREAQAAQNRRRADVLTRMVQGRALKTR